MNRNRYAVCVGVNSFVDPSANLRGCVNDAIGWHGTALNRGYDKTDLLLDGEATRERVVGSLDWAVRQARWGDRILVTFSSHGTWIPDRDGDEPDRRDEAIVCHDFELVTDDDLHRIFQRKAFGVRVTLISDTCHSGTVQRFMPRALPAGAVPRFLSPADLGMMSNERAVRLERNVPARKPRLGPVLLAGCRDDEFSYDAWLEGRYQGALSHAALAALGEQPRSMRAWHDAIRMRLPSQDYPQSPQLQGTAYQKRWRPLA